MFPWVRFIKVSTCSEFLSEDFEILYLCALNRNHAEFSGLLDWGLRLTLLLAMPAAVGMFLLAEGLTAVLYHHGKFSTLDLSQTALAVQAYALGVLGFTLVKILAPGFYAQQNLRSPVKIAVLVLIFTQIGNFFLVLS